MILLNQFTIVINIVIMGVQLQPSTHNVQTFIFLPQVLLFTCIPFTFCFHILYHFLLSCHAFNFYIFQTTYLTSFKHFFDLFNYLYSLFQWFVLTSSNHLNAHPFKYLYLVFQSHYLTSLKILFWLLLTTLFNLFNKFYWHLSKPSF